MTHIRLSNTLDKFADNTESGVTPQVSDGASSVQRDHKKLGNRANRKLMKFRKEKGKAPHLQLHNCVNTSHLPPS